MKLLFGICALLLLSFTGTDEPDIKPNSVVPHKNSSIINRWKWLDSFIST